MELQIERLSKTYPSGKQALDDVSLVVPSGLFGLLGPNGAGKSSLMRTLAGLQQADSGEVRFGEIDVLRDRAALREVLGYLPQEFGLYPTVRAEDLLDHFAALKGFTQRGGRRARVEELLRRTHLWEARRVRLGAFSGGMKQRFGIAIALVGDPRLIIVDEPTAGLDPDERVRFLNLLAELGLDRVVILSTHIVADVADLCSRMAVLCGGRILLCGEPRAEIAALRGRVWKRRCARAELPALEKELPLLSTRLAHGEVELRSWALHPPGPGFELAEPELEDAYFAAIRGFGAPALAARAGLRSAADG